MFSGTLILTVILVVLVIYLFVRRLSATIIPALALAGVHCLHLWRHVCRGYSLNNVFAARLTLAVGSLSTTRS